MLRTDETNEVIKTLANHGLSKTVWGLRILNASKVGGFTPEEKGASGNWVSCACGESQSGIEKVEGGRRPADEELFRLGVLFYEAINDDKYTYASEVLAGIEARATFLIKASNHRNYGARG